MAVGTGKVEGGISTLGHEKQNDCMTIDYPVNPEHPETSRTACEPFTPKSEQFQIYPAASPENITSHNMKSFGFRSLLREQMIVPQILIHHLYISLYKVRRMYVFNLGVKGLNL